MDEANVFGQELVFDYIINQVRHNQNSITDTGEEYIKGAIEYLGKIQNGLITTATVMHFIGQDSLKEIYEEFNGEKNFSPRLILATARQIEDAQGYLEQLIDTPKEFYETPGAGKLIDVCQKVKGVYDRQGKL